MEELSPDVCKNLKGIFSDIDDTISLDGKIPKEAYSALWDAKEAGLRVIPITGRPAGWVDHLVRMWPVDAVIGENGAFYFYFDAAPNTSLQRRFLQDEEERKKNQRNLWKLFYELKQKYPDLSVASDQGYRAVDMAIDFCEDVPPFSDDKINAIVDHFEKAGACAKISSIHVNAWFGDHDKCSCCKLLLKELFQEDFSAVKEQYIYFGDSPNDEPLFEFFPQTVGVANIKNFLPRLQHLPTFITSKEGGRGFAEAIQYILKNRS